MKILNVILWTICALIFIYACTESELTNSHKKVLIETRSSQNQVLFLGGAYPQGSYNQTTGEHYFAFSGNHEFKPYGSETWIDISTASTINVKIACACDNGGGGCSPRVTVDPDGTVNGECDNSCAYGGCTMNVNISNAAAGNGNYSQGGDFRPKQ